MSTREATNQERRAVARAILKYLKGRGEADTQALESFLEARPDSPYALWLSVSVGVAQWDGGRYSKALERLSSVWENTPEADNTNPLRDFAGAKLARCYGKLGRKEALNILLRQLLERPQHAANIGWDLGQAQLALSGMSNQADKAFNCGPYALRSIRTNAERAVRTPEDLLIEKARSAQRGFSLKEVTDLAKDVGMNMKMAKRKDKNVPLQVPSVIHWKSGHYAAVIAKVEDGYLVKDPTFASITVIPNYAINEESSGYFLVPGDSEPSEWDEVDSLQSHRIIGKGMPAGHYANDTGCDNVCGDSYGLPVYGFNEQQGSYVITDTPIWVTSPLGFNIEFSVRHRSFKTAISPTHYINLGTNNWFASWGERVTYSPGEAMIEFGDGRQEIWKEGTVSGGVLNYTHDTRTATFQRTGSAGSYVFTYTRLDGSKMTFSNWSGYFMFLSEVIDDKGRKITIVPETVNTIYKRPKEIKDDYGNGLKILYVGTSGSAIFQISQVQDLKDANRKATFTYSYPGTYRQLDKITDAEGLWAEFTYNPSIEWIYDNGQQKLFLQHHGLHREGNEDRIPCLWKSREYHEVSSHESTWMAE